MAVLNRMYDKGKSVILQDSTYNDREATVDASGNVAVKAASNSGVDIGDVDVLSIAAGNNNIGNVDVESITAGENHLGEIGGKTVIINGTLTRPADTTAYTANDSMSDSTSAPTIGTFTNVARVNAGSGLITNIFVVDSANQSTKPDLELYILDTTAANVNDNAAFTMTDAVLATVVGVVRLNNWRAVDDTSGANGNAFCTAALDAPIPFVCGAASRNLFFRVKVLNAYTPVSAEVFTFRLGADLN